MSNESQSNEAMAPPSSLVDTMYPSLHLDSAPPSAAFIQQPSAPALEELEQTDESFGRNWRYFLSILPGLIHIFIGGIQISSMVLNVITQTELLWTTNSITHSTWVSEPLLSMHQIAQFLRWFVGIAFGTVAAALFIATKPKWMLYVSDI